MWLVSDQQIYLNVALPSVKYVNLYMLSLKTRRCDKYCFVIMEVFFSIAENHEIT
jgi:hypothetical protein